MLSAEQCRHELTSQTGATLRRAIGHVVHALDLGLQVPLALATGSMLLARRAWGYVLAPIFLVNAVCMGLALVMMVATSALAADRSLLEAGPFVVIPLVAIALSIGFFRGVEPANQLGRSLIMSASTPIQEE